MSWRDRIDSELTGSYRGVCFHVERADTTGGRRWLIHEYPRRDKPYAEDMGHKAREWRLQLFVAGDDYDRQRDALIEALDAPGVATLVHPYLGSFTAVASDVRWSESTGDGGVCTFQVTFAEAGDESYSITTVDTQLEVYQASDMFEEVLIECFVSQWRVDTQLEMYQSWEMFEGVLTERFVSQWGEDGLSLSFLPDGWSPVALERDLASIFQGIEDVVGGIADELAAQIRAPMNMVGIVLGGYNRLRNAVLRPINALDLYSGNTILGKRSDEGSGEGDSSMLLTPGTPTRATRLLLEIGTSSNSVTSPAVDMPERRQRAQNTAAARQLNGHVATLTAARLVASIDWMSRQDAEVAGADILALIDAQMTTDEFMTDAVYVALADLRAKVSEDLRTRALALPGLITYTPLCTLPALVVAHRLYGDATRADEIVMRNNVQHPGALRGGIALEVLSE